MLAVLHQGGLTIYLLLVCSLAVLAVALERGIRLRQASADTILFLSKLSRFIAEGRVGEAAAYCDRSRAAVAAVANAGLSKCGRSKDEIRDTLSAAIALQTHLLGRNLPILGTIASTAPFVGLFGTVLGIMRSFHEISVQKTAGLHVVGAGIAEALVATAGGLAVAIAAVVAYNGFQSWISRFTVDMEVVATEVLHMAAREEAYR
jgi:biopolymer transport protein ExbB